MHDKFDKNTDRVKIVLFAATMIVFFVIGLAFFARPERSENEKRDLTDFPKFTIQSFFSGEWTAQVSLWYSDTYPLREGMIETNNQLQALYGIRDQQVILGDQADEIPDETKDPDSEVIFNPTDDGAGEKIQGLYVNNNTAYQLYAFSQQNSDSYVALVNKLAASLKGKAKVYDMIVPLHYEIALLLSLPIWCIHICTSEIFCNIFVPIS